MNNVFRFVLVAMCMAVVSSVASAQVIDCACSSAYSVGDRVQLTQDMDDSSGLLAGAVGTVLCGSASGNLYVSWDAWSDGHNSNGSCACESGDDDPDNSHWYVSCSKVVAYAPIDCSCASQYSVGDRVELMQDLDDSSGLVAGSVGTVVCGRTSYLILIDWDELVAGHDGYGYCVCGGEVGSAVSNWYVDCDKIGPTSVIECACDSEYSVGDRVTLLVDNPDGATNLPAGSAGTVLCGDGGASYDLYVSWDSWSDGHNETAYCDCQSGAGDLDNSHWLVQCGQVRHGEPGTIEVPGDYATIQEAMNVSIDGDTIQIAAGTYYENNLSVWGRAVTISGAMDPDGNPTTIVDGEDAGTVFYFQDGETNSTRLENIVIQNGFYSGNGGGVFVIDSEPWFANCTFRSNTAEIGGGVYLIGSYDVKFEGCRFVDNHAAINGGGLYADSVTYFQLWDSTFDGNSATGVGGGAYVNSTSYPAVIHDTEFVGNVAEYGGGLYAYWVVMNMVGNVFRDNVAGRAWAAVSTSSQCDAWIQSLPNRRQQCPERRRRRNVLQWRLGHECDRNILRGKCRGQRRRRWVDYATTPTSTLYLFDCTFMGNQAEIGGGMYSYWSGSGTLQLHLQREPRDCGGGRNLGVCRHFDTLELHVPRKLGDGL